MESQITFFKNHCKSKFKMLKVENKEELGRKKSYKVERNLMKTSEKSFSVSWISLKNESKGNSLSHLIAKTRLHTSIVWRGVSFSLLGTPLAWRPATPPFLKLMVHILSGLNIHFFLVKHITDNQHNQSSWFLTLELFEGILGE